MRVSARLAAAAMTVLGLAAPAQAGVLELINDPITLHWNCDITPCRGNTLAYKRVYVRDHYLAYDIHTRPAHYVMRKVRVMVAPPTVVVTSGESHDRHWLDFGDRNGLVALPVSGYRVVKPAQYAWVTKSVLVTPGHAYVTRRSPHYAYFPEDIVVQGSGW